MNWSVVQLDGSKRDITPPDLWQDISMLEAQSYLMWLPSVINVPTLLALRDPARGGGPSAAPAPITPHGAGGGV
jgi:hypothetical protein